MLSRAFPILSPYLTWVSGVEAGRPRRRFTAERLSAKVTCAQSRTLPPFTSCHQSPPLSPHTFPPSLPCPFQKTFPLPCRTTFGPETNCRSRKLAHRHSNHLVHNGRERQPRRPRAPADVHRWLSRSEDRQHTGWRCITVVLKKQARRGLSVFTETLTGYSRLTAKSHLRTVQAV